MRRGQKDSCRQSSIAEFGTPIGRKRVIATRSQKRGWAGCPSCPRRRDSGAISRPAETGERMLKVAIVGCGKIADAHASQIQRIKGCEIVGVCDRERLMAQQLYQRFPIKRRFSDVSELLSESRPDIVHITTPPASHFDLARRCLESGCHVYV